MKNNKASIAIFQKSADEEHISCPNTPDEIFEAAKEVIANKSQKIIRLASGTYLVEYSPTGPFSAPTPGEWLPVYVAKLLKWSSGGIKKEEFEKFDPNYTLPTIETMSVESNPT